MATIIHAVVELIALEIIFGNPERFANTFWWRNWDTLHWFVANVLWFIGSIVGVRYGFKYWKPYGCKPGFYHWHAHEQQSEKNLDL